MKSCSSQCSEANADIKCSTSVLCAEVHWFALPQVLDQWQAAMLIIGTFPQPPQMFLTMVDALALHLDEPDAAAIAGAIERDSLAVPCCLKSVEEHIYKHKRLEGGSPYDHMLNSASNLRESAAPRHAAGLGSGGSVNRGSAGGHVELTSRCLEGETYGQQPKQHSPRAFADSVLLT